MFGFIFSVLNWDDEMSSYVETRVVSSCEQFFKCTPVYVQNSRDDEWIESDGKRSGRKVGLFLVKLAPSEGDIFSDRISSHSCQSSE